MKILVVTQKYWPENFRISDIAETLVAKGNNVTVLCGLPNYPEGYIYDEYKKWHNRSQTHNGVKIIRAREIARRKNIFSRFLNYWSFSFFGKLKIRKLNRDFDVVLINELSPIMGAIPGIKYARKYGRKIVMYEMDLWPESLLAGGIKRNSFIYEHYLRKSAKIYYRCDKILVSTKEHIEYIKNLPNCNSLNIDYLPQYAETIFENSSFLPINNGVIDLMFAGNIGKAQSVSTIIKAANLLKNDTRFKFHIIGSGSELENVKNLADALQTKNVIFYEKRPLSEMPKYYSLADVMLVTLESQPYANMTIPGKVQSYMAAGKPILGVISGSANKFIIDNKIGFAVEAEDYTGFANLVKSLPEINLLEIGKHAKECYMEKYSKEIFMIKLMKELNNKRI